MYVKYAETWKCHNSVGRPGRNTGDGENLGWGGEKEVLSFAIPKDSMFSSFKIF